MMLNTKRPLPGIRLSAALSAALSIQCMMAFASAQVDVGAVDFVAFFHRALSDPPDVARFVASSRLLRELHMPEQLRRLLPEGVTVERGIVTYEGARAGDNFYLRSLAEDESLTDTTAGTIKGRRGLEAYTVNPNTLYYSRTGSSAGGLDPVGSWASAGYRMVRQFLNMGLAEDIQASTLEWAGNEFAARLTDGSRLYGRLAVSNETPVSLEVSRGRTLPPYKSFAYTYPHPPTALAGFPAVTTISRAVAGASDRLEPWMELTLQAVQLSPERLPEAHFDRSQFIGRHIMYTNVFQEGVLYQEAQGGQLVRAPVQPVVQIGEARFRHRWVIIWCFFGAIAILPLLALTKHLRDQTRKP